MKIRTVTNAFLVGLLSVATGSVAVAEPPEPGPGRPGARQQRVPFFRMLDEDRDGQVSTAEIDQWAAKFKDFDGDDDGLISPEEMRSAVAKAREAFGGPRGGGPGDRPRGPRPDGQQPGRGLERLFERDADGDGKLSAEELPEPLQDRLERLDANGDGLLDREELAQARRRRGQRGPGPGPGRPHGPRPRPERPEAPGPDGIDV